MYTGTKPVISSLLACISCTSLGIDGLLTRLNEIMGTVHDLDDDISVHLKACITKKYDFGMAYARLRPWWPGSNADFSTLQTILDRIEAEDRQIREGALDESGNYITKTKVGPRRIWDLYSNRVVPAWLGRSPVWAISHSWMKERKYVHTPINSYQWPVPIPQDDSMLERVRIELLNIGAEYVWLDVLCLRQESREEDETIRIEEWKLDVPTIGDIYHQNQMVIQYFNGLGRPFRINGLVDLTEERHWLNRAWTLQEISSNNLTAGIVGDSPEAPEKVGTNDSLVPINLSKHDNDGVQEFFRRFASLQKISQEVDSIFPVLAAMRGRSGTFQRDLIGGLVYLLRSNPLPVYDSKQDSEQYLEEAWSKLLRTMAARYRGDLLFLGPAFEGERQESWAPFWAPSWKQVMDISFPRAKGIYIFEVVTPFQEAPIYSHCGYRVDNCQVRGFSCQAGDCGEPEVRKGIVTVADINGDGHSFEMTCRVSGLIPEDELFTLVGSEGLQYWIVARASGVVPHLKKISVLRMASDFERMRSLALHCYSSYV